MDCGEPAARRRDYRNVAARSKSQSIASSRSYWISALYWSAGGRPRAREECPLRAASLAPPRRRRESGRGPHELLHFLGSYSAAGGGRAGGRAASWHRQVERSGGAQMRRVLRRLTLAALPQLLQLGADRTARKGCSKSSSAKSSMDIARTEAAAASSSMGNQPVFGAP